MRERYNPEKDPARPNLPVLEVEIKSLHSHSPSCEVCQTPLQQKFEPMELWAKKFIVRAPQFPYYSCECEDCEVGWETLEPAASLEFDQEALRVLSQAGDRSSNTDLRQSIKAYHQWQKGLANLNP